MTQEPKPTRPKVLVVDDDLALLELYRQLLAQLPSNPEIYTANAGSRALALLKSESFRLLICDLRMPKMDGLQVLSIVRRSFPELRTVVVTGVADEQFRSRAYALGVDLFWMKPDTHENMEMFLQCVESLLGRETESGFRGIQSKGLMDLLQMECLSQSSTVLRITRGALVGKIWILSGELIDAEIEGARGEAALRRILEWKSGTFENLPAEPSHERAINKPINALLLEAAQAIDEDSAPPEAVPGGGSEEADHRKTVWRLSALTREGADFVVSLPEGGKPAPEGWGTEATKELGHWMGEALEACQRLSQMLDTGPLSHVEGRTLNHRIIMLPQENHSYLIGWPVDAKTGSLSEASKKLIASWES